MHSAPSVDYPKNYFYDFYVEYDEKISSKIILMQISKLENNLNANFKARYVIEK